MAASWCKVASNLDSHPKIRRAGRNGREVFLFALRRNAEPNNPRRGLVPKDQLDPWYIADQLQMSEGEARDGLAACARASLLLETPDHWAICGWEEREWGRFAKEGAERTADWRRRKAPNAGDASVTVGDAGDGCDGGEERRSEEKRGDKMRGEEREVPLAPPPTRSRRKGVASVLPADWTPGPFAVPAGVDVQRELERFRNHATASGRRLVDWNAGWRNWLLKAEEYVQARPKQQMSAFAYTMAVANGEIP